MIDLLASLVTVDHSFSLYSNNHSPTSLGAISPQWASCWRPLSGFCSWPCSLVNNLQLSLLRKINYTPWTTLYDYILPLCLGKITDSEPHSYQKCPIWYFCYERHHWDNWWNLDNAYKLDNSFESPVNFLTYPQQNYQNELTNGEVP